jgi:ketosteroid isomerase-like protein
VSGHAALTDWIDRYERAWRTPGTDALAGLFTEDAVYSPAPFDEPLRGLAAIARFWEDEREGPDEVFTLRSRVVAVEGATGVARIDVEYGDPPTLRYADMWVVTLTSDRRCSAFEEWPFFPGQGRIMT